MPKIVKFLLKYFMVYDGVWYKIISNFKSNKFSENLINVEGFCKVWD